MMTGFDDLPNDLVLELWHHVLPPDDIVSFALVSKRIFALAAPFLKEYHRLRSKYSDFANYRGYDGIMLAHLLKDVLFDPHIAFYIEELRICTWQTSWADPVHGTPINRRADVDPKTYVFHVPYPKQDMELFRNGIRNAEYMFPVGIDAWIQLLETGHEDPILALLLSLLPNLRRLRLEYPPAQSRLFTTIRRMIETAVPVSFSKLESIHLVSGQNEGISLITSFASLPSLEKISCYTYISCDQGPDIPECLVSPRSSNVTELVFDSYSDTATPIFVLLEGIKVLKKFTYVGHHTPFDLSGLRTALLNHCRHSLEYLKVLPFEYVDSKQADTLGSLRLFENLKYLEVDHSILVNLDASGNCNVSDLLPASVEAIVMTGLCSETLSHLRPVIRSLVSAKRTELPDLKRVEFSNLFGDWPSIFLDPGDYSSSESSDMRQLCDRNGVLLNPKRLVLEL